MAASGWTLVLGDRKLLLDYDRKYTLLSSAHETRKIHLRETGGTEVVRALLINI